MLRRAVALVLLSGLVCATAFMAPMPMKRARGVASAATLLQRSLPRVDPPVQTPELRKTYIECGQLSNVRA
jgi:hypothetical protein